MQQVGETQFLFNIADADSINHIVLFMTGTTPFPDGMGGAGNKYMFKHNFIKLSGLATSTLGCKLYLFTLKYSFAVYFNWPSPDGSQSWHLVGHVTNQKPSLIFKVSNLKGKNLFYADSYNHSFFKQQSEDTELFSLQVQKCYILNFTYGVLSYPIMYSDDLLHSCTIRVQPLAPSALTEE